MIDADGNIYGEGRITFPPDPAGSFSAPEADLVQVSIAGPNSLTFAPSRALRDPTTGYLAIDSTAPRISIPQGLGPLLLAAFGQSHPANPITFAFDAAGQLSNASETDRVRQGLSDWRGSVTYTDRALIVRVSAALRSQPPIHSWDGLEDPWQTDDEVPDRISIAFELDAMTSFARFRGYRGAFSGHREQELSPVVRTSLDAMRLESAPIGLDRTIYGVTKSGLYVAVHEVDGLWNSMTLSASSAEYRSTNGLLMGDSRFPRITFRGVNLNVVAGGLWATRSFSLTLTNGRIGLIEWSAGSSEGPGRSTNLLEASLNFELTVDGLVMSYSTRPESSAPGTLPGELTIPWEVLIVRSPLFAKQRENLSVGKPQFGP
jgi:hypothetical protein